MMKLATGNILFLVVTILLFVGCCKHNKSIESEPPYPTTVTGWRYKEENGLGIVGEFVLKKEESTNNGEVEIKIADLIPADDCADLGTAPSHKQVKVQFIRLKDQKVVCEETVPDTYGGNQCGSALDEFRIFGIGVRGINIKEQWVHFILDGAEKEPKSDRQPSRRPTPKQ